MDMYGPEIIRKTVLVINSCKTEEQIKVAGKYADNAFNALLDRFGMDLTSEQALVYADFKALCFVLMERQKAKIIKEIC